MLPLRIGLTQQDLHLGYDRLMDVSDPTSSNYGKYLSAEDVHDVFKPSDDAVNAVKKWLVEEGVNASDIICSANKGWIAVDLPAEQIERLLNTKYFEYSHSDASHIAIGCEAYSLPSSVRQHIDYVKPGVVLVKAIKSGLDKRHLSEVHKAASHLSTRRAVADRNSLIEAKDASDLSKCREC